MYILYNFLNLVAYCKNTLYGTFIKYVLLTLFRTTVGLVKFWGWQISMDF